MRITRKLCKRGNSTTLRLSPDERRYYGMEETVTVLYLPEGILLKGKHDFDGALCHEGKVAKRAKAEGPLS